MAPVDPAAAELKNQLDMLFAEVGAPNTLTNPPQQAADPTVVLRSRFKVRARGRAHLPLLCLNMFA